MSRGVLQFEPASLRASACAMPTGAGLAVGEVGAGIGFAELVLVTGMSTASSGFNFD
ncbi:MAG: hypothetical protein WCJ02_06845 [bacterium]